MKSNNLKILFASIAVLAGALLVSAGLVFIRKKPAEKPPEELARSVSVIKAEAKDLRISASGFGTAEPYIILDVYSEVKGRILSSGDNTSSGELFEKGELIVEIDPADYKAALASAEAQVRQLDAQIAKLKQQQKDDTAILEICRQDLKLEEEDYQRIKDLFEKGATSRSEVTNALQLLMEKKNICLSHQRDVELYPLEIEILEAQKADAASKVDQAKVNLERCTIRTPFKGRTQSSDFEDGQFVSEGTKICTIVEEHCIDIPVAVNALDAMNLGLKMDGGAGFGHWFTGYDKVEVEACWVERPEVKWKGKVRRVSRFDADTRTAVILARIEESKDSSGGDFPLVSGMFCKVTFYGRTVENAIEIPRSALQFDGKLFIVGTDGRIRGARPKIVHRTENSIFVSEGVSDGDLVAAFRIQQGIVDGMKVNPVLTDSGKAEKE